MDADVRTLDTGQIYTVFFGRNALHPQTMGEKAEELVEKFYG